MNEVKEFLQKYQIKPLGYTKCNKAIIIKTRDGKYVLKKHNPNNIYQTLKLRNVNFIPKRYNLYDDDLYQIEDYIDSYDIPNYEKAEEIINLISLLHNKTTIYNEIDIDDFKIIYEDLNLKISDLVSYYNGLNDYIDNEIYMSPANYLLVRNISKIYATLDFCKKELDTWYELIKNSNKQRKVLIHNNLSLDHLLRSNNASYLISYDKAKYDLPIYDIYKLYKNINKEVEFESLFDLYQSKYPLHEEELKLLFIMISLPDKVIFTEDEYNNCLAVTEMLSYISKTEKLISKYYTQDENKEKDNFSK